MVVRPRSKRRDTLVVGVTGHRPHRLDAIELARLLSHARDVLRDLAQAAAGQGTADVILVSALAEGADRHLARLALARGYGLHAVLPFAREEYATDFDTSESVTEFERLLDDAQRVVELPGDRRRSGEAYEAAGHAILDVADLLVAVWDGAPGRGRGGTAEVVAEAWRRRMPIVHLSTRVHAQPTLLHSAAKRAPALDMDRLPDRALAPDTLRVLVASLLAARDAS